MKGALFLGWWLLSGFTLFSAPGPTESKQNLGDLNAAIATFEKKDFSAAENQFRALLQRPLTTSTRGKTTFNLGITLKLQKKSAEAVRTFESLLTSDVNDREPGEHLMEEFTNYRYRACLQIASCYASQNDFSDALNWAKAARDKYRHEAHCGTCAAQAKQSLDHFLTTLQSKANK